MFPSKMIPKFSFLLRRKLKKTASPFNFKIIFGAIMALIMGRTTDIPAFVSELFGGSSQPVSRHKNSRHKNSKRRHEVVPETKCVFSKIGGQVLTHCKDKALLLSRATGCSQISDLVSMFE